MPGVTELYAGKPGRPNDATMTVIPGGEGTPIPEPPKGLKDADTWTRLWTIGRAWLSNDAHYDLMRVLCEAMEDRDRVRRTTKRVAVMSVGSKGQPIIHPAFRQLDMSELKVARLMALAGFIPAPHKTRVAHPNQAKRSKLDDLRASRSGT
jgi:hypothetical protein